MGRLLGYKERAHTGAWGGGGSGWAPLKTHRENLRKGGGKTKVRGTCPQRGGTKNLSGESHHKKEKGGKRAESKSEH